MSESVTSSSSGAHSSITDQLPTMTINTQSSCVQGMDNEESTGESSEEQVNNMVGWTVYKKTGVYDVKGRVMSYNSKTKIYEVMYKNGLTEKVIKEHLVRYLSPCRPGDEQPSGSALRMRAQNAGHISPARKAAKRTRAGTAPAQQSRQVSCGSATVEMPTADSGNEGKKRYQSLRMNAER